MKILLVTSDGFGLATGLQFLKDGCEVKAYVKDPAARKDFYEGMVDKVEKLADAKGWAEFVVFMNNHLVPEWKECSSWGVPVYGGSEAGENLEHDRPGAQKLAKSFGLEVPKHATVKTVEEAEKYLSENPGPMVLKFVGGNTDSDDVLLGEYEDNRDLIRFSRFIEQTGKKWDEIEIDQFIPGIEVGIAGYFDGTKFAPGLEINFQGKRFCAGEQGNGVGFLTGEMHTVIKYVDQKNAFYKKTLAKMIPHLKKIGYRGQIDIGTIVRIVEGDIFFVENTPREGCPDFVIRFELQVTPTHEMFFAVASGDVQKNQVRGGWAVGVVVVSPGFPDVKSAEKRSVGLPVFGLDENEGHAWPFEVKKTEAGYEVAKGGYGYPCVVTAKGPTLESAVRRVYWILNRANPDRVCVPKAWYRDDVGQRVLENQEEIIALGILTQEEWDA